jgi:hypothetical protein
MAPLYRLIQVERLEGTGRALAHRQPDGSVLVMVLASLPAAEQKRAAHEARAALLRQEGRPLAAFALPAALAAAGAGRLAVHAALSRSALLAAGATVTSAAVAGAMWATLPEMTYHPSPVAVPPAVSVPAPVPAARAGVTSPQARHKPAAGMSPMAHGGHGMPSSPAAAPGTPSTVPPPSVSPPPTLPLPLPSPSVTLPLPLPTPTLTLPLPHKHKHKICVGLIVAGVCVKL